MKKLDKLPKREYLYWFLAWVNFYLGDFFSRLPWYWSATMYGKFMETSSDYADGLTEFDGPWSYVPADEIEEVYEDILPADILYKYSLDIINLNGLLFELNYYEKANCVNVGFCAIEKQGHFKRPQILYTMFEKLKEIEHSSPSWWFGTTDYTSRRKLVKRARIVLYKQLLEEVKHASRAH